MCDSVDQRDAEAAVLSRFRVGPVLGALDLHLLQQVSEHDYSGRIVVPHQTPEVPDGVW